ncbi:hypothetical protein [Marilutibacter chinensis]|uniref:Uncharacterized protein n=1 Tax=Marilutibacter chinensis TaxID=2912247 RepID=A0ABS9HXK1_9GAMM|nr:hypothetical protein [Lysobacter chinensis]MCF7223606.1 hypothetical protein [Lysobacter chinensis]
MSATKKIHSSARSLVLAAAAVPLIAFAQQGGPAGMAAQMTKLGGMMHATAKACGDYSDQELAALKQQQKATHLERGLDAASFEQAFAAADAEISRRWGAMSPAERTRACNDIRQQMSAMSQ